MNFNYKVFNQLRRDKDGPRVQRHWIPEYKGLGVDLGLTKKSLIFRFRSPVKNKARIIVLENFNCKQKITQVELD